MCIQTSAAPKLHLALPNETIARLIWPLCTHGGLSLDDPGTCCAMIVEHKLVGIEIAEFQNAWEGDNPPVSPGPLIGALGPRLEQAAQ